MDQNFLRDVQRAGWQLIKVNEVSARVQCPRHGCGMRFDLHQDKAVPQSCDPQPEFSDVLIDQTADIRVLLRAIREGLGLTIKEVEEMAGASVDFFAKAEKNEPSKFPNFQTVLEWAASLGVQIYARRGPLPGMSLRYLAQSRKQAAMRTRLLHHHRARRAGGAQSEPE